MIPMAQQVNKDMLFELKDLIHRREHHIHISGQIWPLRRKG